MKLQPSPTMTVDTLAAEIRRQADYHAAQAYPFPALEIRVLPQGHNGWSGRIRVTCDASPHTGVVIRLEAGTASLQIYQPGQEITGSSSVTEWSAAMAAIGPFLPAEQAAVIERDPMLAAARMDGRVLNLAAWLAQDAAETA